MADREEKVLVVSSNLFLAYMIAKLIEEEYFSFDRIEISCDFQDYAGIVREPPMLVVLIVPESNTDTFLSFSNLVNFLLKEKIPFITLTDSPHTVYQTCYGDIIKCLRITEDDFPFKLANRVTKIKNSKVVRETKKEKVKKIR